VSCRPNSPISANPPDSRILGTWPPRVSGLITGGLGSAGPFSSSTALSLELWGSYTALPVESILRVRVSSHASAHQASDFSRSFGEVVFVVVLVVLSNLAVRRGGVESVYVRLSRLLRGHDESASWLDKWRIRAGAAVTTREVRKGRLAKIMLSVD
jgi:hypothetical protein